MRSALLSDRWHDRWASIIRAASWIGPALLLVSGCKEKPSASIACANCEIVLQRVGEISDAFDPGALPDNLVYAERDAAGRLYIVSSRKDAVLVFSADGELIKRLGQTGDGPGEFRTVRRVLIGPSDSIYVADWSLRINVFSPASGTRSIHFARTVNSKNHLVWTFPCINRTRNSLQTDWLRQQVMETFGLSRRDAICSSAGIHTQVYGNSQSPCSQVGSRP